MNRITVTRAVYEVLDRLPEREISGRELKYMVSLRLENKDPYHSTVLEKARNYAEITGATFECIDGKRSLYRYVPGFGMGSAIVSGKE